MFTQFAQRNVWFNIFCGLGMTSMVLILYGLYTEPTNPISSSIDLNTSSEKVKQLQPTVNQQLAVENRALIFLIPTLKQHSPPTIVIAMLYCRFKFTELKYQTSGLQPLVKANSVGLYSVIVFEDLRIYLSMDLSDRQKLHNYCLKYGVGIITFMQTLPDEFLFGAKILDFPMTYSTTISVKNYTVLKSPVTDITQAEVTHEMQLLREWTVFHPNHTTYQVIGHGFPEKDLSVKYNVAVLDNGLYDGVRRILFGHKHHIWLHKILFLDSLSFLTQGAMRISKDKYVQIDIDDVFLGASGTKMNPTDVKALLNAQTIWRKHYVKDFSFFLGFSGKFYQTGNQEEQDGDKKLLELSSEFKWFDHTFSHVQAHKYEKIEDLIAQMELSKKFAEEHNITVDRTYSVAPHHSGVYPIHQQLYDAWKHVWDIKVTSTEEYPHLKPPWFIRGFIHDGIQVLPRQVCGLYTKTYKYADYPNGGAALEYNIQGGDLFDTLLYNYINFYMTHQQNYGNDRLAIYTFDKLFHLFYDATTLNLRWASPLVVAQDYFKKYPAEKHPTWLNPCDDHRHMEIWSTEKNCQALPNLLVVGPQKTGTTALYKYLKVHPNITSNKDSPETYEEIQFFGTDRYNRGLDWYLDFFPAQNEVVFEKSANYFDNVDVPKQAFALLPEAKIIIILLDPIERALSWYHHQRAHKDPIAEQFTFNEIISSDNTTINKGIRSLKIRMLKPGFYYEHIQRWRQYYPDNQILYVDGEVLRLNPALVMKQIQQFLKMQYILDFDKILTFDEEKGFYCIKKLSGGRECLGKSKGRSKSYGQVESQSKSYLEKVFATPNLYLKNLLKQIKRPLPKWLQST